MTTTILQPFSFETPQYDRKLRSCPLSPPPPPRKQRKLHEPSENIALVDSLFMPSLTGTRHNQGANEPNLNGLMNSITVPSLTEESFQSLPPRITLAPRPTTHELMEMSFSFSVPTTSIDITRSRRRPQHDDEEEESIEQEPEDNERESQDRQDRNSVARTNSMNRKVHANAQPCLSSPKRNDRKVFNASCA